MLAHNQKTKTFTKIGPTGSFESTGFTGNPNRCELQTEPINICSTTDKCLYTLENLFDNSYMTSC